MKFRFPLISPRHERNTTAITRNRFYSKSACSLFTHRTMAIGHIDISHVETTIFKMVYFAMSTISFKCHKIRSRSEAES